MRTIMILLLCMSTSFAIAQISSKAVEKNNQAVKAVINHSDNPDSLNKAISLLDEAIAIEPSYKLAYGNKAKYLMALGQKEKALRTFLEIEELASQDPYYLLEKGMLLEENAKQDLALKAYKQATSLFEQRLKDKPTEADLMNYTMALFLRDNKTYSLEEIEKKYPKVFSASVRQYMEMMNDIYNKKKKREDAIHEMLGGRIR